LSIWKNPLALSKILLKLSEAKHFSNLERYKSNEILKVVASEINK